MFDIGTQVRRQKLNKGHKNFPRKIIKKKNPLLHHTAGLLRHASSEKGITCADGKTGPFPLWVVAELLLVILAKYITPHLF